MNGFNIFLKFINKIIDMLKTCVLDMSIFSNLSNKILVNEARNFCYRN